MKPKPNMPLLKDLRGFIGNHLADIANGLDPQYKLTLVARFPGERSKTIIVTDDDTVLASKELSAPDDDLVTINPSMPD